MADGTLSHIHCFQELLPIVVAVAVWLVIVGKAHIFCHSQTVADVTQSIPHMVTVTPQPISFNAWHFSRRRLTAEVEQFIF